MSESKIKKSALSFPVTFEEVEDVGTNDSRFTKVKIWLMHLGENLNGSVFEKSVVDKAISTLQYIPIMGFIELNDDDEKDFSNHRYIITRNEKGLYRKYMGVPYGVIKSSIDNNAHYEERLCDDGEIREFLVTDGILWNVLEDGYEIFHRDLIKKQSMELDEDSVDGYVDEETGLFHFTKFSFRAACVLGNDDDIQPAMMNSTIEVQFTVNDFVRDIQSELNDKYSAFTKLVESTDFTKAKMVNEKNNNGGIKEMAKTDFMQTVLNQFQDIANMVAQHSTFKDRWGDEVSRYYAVDIQENEVIVVDRMDNYNHYGVSFTIEGDKPVLNFEKCKRKKVQYVDYSEGTVEPNGAFNFGEHISEIEDCAFTKVEDVNAKLDKAEEKIAEIENAKNEAETNYTNIKADYDELKPKYDEFVEAEQQRVEAELDAQKDAEFAKYESILVDCAEFEALKDKKSDMTVKEIESECAILFARKSLANTNFSKVNNSNMTAGIIDNTKNNDNLVETRYGYIPIKR